MNNGYMSVNEVSGIGLDIVDIDDKEAAKSDNNKIKLGRFAKRWNDYKGLTVTNNSNFLKR